MFCLNIHLLPNIVLANIEGIMLVCRLVFAGPLYDKYMH